MRLPRRSLIRRLLRWQVLTMLVTWAALCGNLVLQMSYLENGDMDRRMASFASALAEAAAGSHAAPGELPTRVQAIERVFVSGVIETLEHVAPYQPSYQVLDSSNRVVYRTETAPEAPWTNSLGFADMRLDGWHVRLVRTQSFDHTISVIVAESDAMRGATMLPILSIVGGSEVVTLLISIGVLWWTAHRAFAPVHELAVQVTERQVGDLTPIEDKAGYRELEPLIRSFNGLLIREANRLDQERGFLADAAHELRTPLAAISAQAHQLTSAADNTGRQVAAQQLQGGVQRVSHLLSQLLTTARIDASDVFMKMELINVAELVRLRAASFVTLARRKAIALEIDAPDVAAAMANPFGLTSIIDNLLDNAIRHTPEGGQVLLSLGDAGADLELQVQDSGPGIAPELHLRVFERFYRIPGNDAPGSGLGLAIVHKLAAAYGGKISLGEGLGGRGLSVGLTLPRGVHPNLARTSHDAAR